MFTQFNFLLARHSWWQQLLLCLPFGVFFLPWSFSLWAIFLPESTSFPSLLSSWALFLPGCCFLLNLCSSWFLSPPGSFWSFYLPKYFPTLDSFSRPTLLSLLILLGLLSSWSFPTSFSLPQPVLDLLSSWSFAVPGFSSLCSSTLLVLLSFSFFLTPDNYVFMWTSLFLGHLSSICLLGPSFLLGLFSSWAFLHPESSLILDFLSS